MTKLFSLLVFLILAVPVSGQQRKKVPDPSRLRIYIRHSKTAAPMHAWVSIKNDSEAKSHPFEVKSGYLEQMFSVPVDLELTAFAQGFTSVTGKMKIDIVPGGKVYEFIAVLAPIAHALTLKVVDFETGEVIPKARIDLKNLSDNKVLTFTTGADGKHEIAAPANNSYEISCSADGYYLYLTVLDINKEKNEDVVRLRKLPNTQKHVIVSVADKYSGENLNPEITYAGKAVKDQDFILTGNSNDIITLKAAGYSPSVSRVLTPLEISSGKASFVMEKAEYDFTFKILSLANRQTISNFRFTLMNFDSKAVVPVKISNGQVILRLPPKGKYIVNASSESFENIQIAFDPVEELLSRSSGRELLLKPISPRAANLKKETTKPIVSPEFGELKKGISVVLNNIFFDQSSAVLRTESYSELDKLAEILNCNPPLKIEIRGHTDNTGNFDANVKLSRERCEAVVKYLLSRGALPTQLQFVGRGPVDAVAPNTTEENKKKNRRVEFIVL